MLQRYENRGEAHPTGEILEEGDEEEPFECDEDIAQEDLVSGWIRMGLLPRLRYILEVQKSPVHAVPVIKMLLIRIDPYRFPY